MEEEFDGFVVEKKGIGSSLGILPLSCIDQCSINNVIFLKNN